MIGQIHGRGNLYYSPPQKATQPSYTINPDGTIDVQAVPVNDAYTPSNSQPPKTLKRKEVESSDDNGKWKWLLGISTLIGFALLALGLRGRHMFLQEYQEAVDAYLKDKPTGGLLAYEYLKNNTETIQNSISRYREELKDLRKVNRTDPKIEKLESKIRYLEQRLQVNKKRQLKCNLNKVNGKSVLVVIPESNTGFSVHEGGEVPEQTTSHFIPSIRRDGNFMALRSDNPWDPSEGKDHSDIAQIFTENIKQNSDLPSNFHLDSQGKVVGFDIHSRVPLLSKWGRFIAKGLGLQAKLPVPETTNHYVELRDGDPDKLKVMRVYVHRPDNKVAKSKK